MGTTAEKLTYLNGTKRLLRRRINSLGGNITLDTRFRDYLLWLNRFYDAASSPVKFEILGETTQKAVNTSTNELYIPDGEIVTDGITLTISNGKITINGTAERDVWVKITNGIEVVYTKPITWRTGLDFDDPYGWTEEKVIEYDEPTKTYTQFCHGTGDAPTGTATSNGVNVVIKYSNNSYTSLYQNFNSFRDRTYTDMHVEGTATSDNVVEVNCVFLYFNQGITVNQYFWLQQCLTQESTWTPNYDAAPASPDNPKWFWSPDDITYTASDGTEFPLYLTYPDAPYNFVLGGIGDYKDRIYYKNGKFYCERKIGIVTLNGTESDSDYEADVGIGDIYFFYYLPLHSSGVNQGVTIDKTPYLCNYFKNGEMIDVGDYQVEIIGNTPNSSGNDCWFSLSSTRLNEVSVAGFKTWLTTHPTIVYYVLRESVITEITEENGEVLYTQLKAIIDYETQLQIEKKIF